MAKATKSQKYADLISKTQTEVQAEIRELSVLETKNVLEMGTLDVKGQMIKAESEVKAAKLKVSSAERDLETAKSQVPFNVQGILSARTAIIQAGFEVDAKQDVLNQKKDAYDYLVALNAELF